MPGDKISNLFDAKIINKTNKDLPIELKVEGFDADVRLVGTKTAIVLKKESVNEVTFFVDIPKAQLKERSSSVKIGVYQNGSRIQTVKTKFLGPFI